MTRRGRSLSALLALSVAACELARSPSMTMSAAQATAIGDSVQAFAESVASGVSRSGPSAWRTFFADTTAFFMANSGRLVFPSGESAARGIRDLEPMISHIELRWGDSLRIDPLAPGLAMVATPWHEVIVDRAGKRMQDSGFFTGLAQHRGGAWQFRNAHWSELRAQPSAP